jgi:hypothetical protein
MKIHDLTPDEVAEWRACSAPVLEEYMSRTGGLSEQLMSLRQAANRPVLLVRSKRRVHAALAKGQQATAARSVSTTTSAPSPQAWGDRPNGHADELLGMSRMKARQLIEKSSFDPDQVKAMGMARTMPGHGWRQASMIGRRRSRRRASPSRTSFLAWAVTEISIRGGLQTRPIDALSSSAV